MSIIKTARKNIRLTQKQLSEIAGTHIITIQRLEAEPWRINKLTLETAMRISAACNLDIYELVENSKQYS